MKKQTRQHRQRGTWRRRIRSTRIQGDMDKIRRTSRDIKKDWNEKARRKRWEENMKASRKGRTEKEAS